MFRIKNYKVEKLNNKTVEQSRVKNYMTKGIICLLLRQGQK